MSCLGIDIGSRTTKYVILGQNGLARVKVMDAGVNPMEKLRLALREQNLRETQIAATGYGRYLAQDSLSPENSAKSKIGIITEIKAFSLGAHYLYPPARLVIDIGGQDTKVIALSGDGFFENFEINDRCAAGTGRFLEVMARAFEMDIAEFGPFALTAGEGVKINSMCTVFAESEVISLLAKRENPKSIALGIHQSVVERIYTMIKRVGFRQPVFFAGGGALNPCLARLLEKKLKVKLIVPENPQIVGALGAASYAGRQSWLS